MDSITGNFVYQLNTVTAYCPRKNQKHVDG